MPLTWRQQLQHVLAALWLKKILFRAQFVPQTGCFHKICNDISGIIGEPGRIRTFDPLIKSQLLYHLSYGPIELSGTLSAVFKQYPNLPHRLFWHCALIARKAHEMA